jgi:hypothetical protein
MRRFSGILFFGLLWLGLYAATAYAQQGATTTPDTAGAASITVLFAPLLAASTGIERLLEMFWNWFEALFVNFIAFVAMGWEWTRWAREEVELTTQAINTLATQLAQLRRAPATPARVSQEVEIINKLRTAEEGLRTAQEHLRGVLKSDRYRGIKQALSVLAGIALGMIVSAAANLKMFALLGISGVPAGADVIVTGLVIGTGAGPVHSLVGILQQGKETIEQTSALLKGRSQLTQSELTTRANSTTCNTPPTG